MVVQDLVCSVVICCQYSVCSKLCLQYIEHASLWICLWSWICSAEWYILHDYLEHLISSWWVSFDYMFGLDLINYFLTNTWTRNLDNDKCMFKVPFFWRWKDTHWYITKRSISNFVWHWSKMTLILLMQILSGVKPNCLRAAYRASAGRDKAIAWDSWAHSPSG